MFQLALRQYHRNLPAPELVPAVLAAAQRHVVSFAPATLA